MIVCKFGGSSVADAAHIRKVKAIVEADEDRKVVVVSAPGKRRGDDQKVTDMLYACNSMVREGLSCRELFKKVTARYTDILRELGMDEKPFLPILEEVRRQIDAGRGAEYAASRGEYLSARLVASYFGWEFLDAAPAIVIDSDGTVDESTWKHLSHAIADGKRYVVPGFYGVDHEGKVKTFSRGGSDITGAILSRAVEASLYENWTDVSGIYSADPRLVRDARVIPVMSYREVRELGGVGAGVFHEEAIAPIVSKGIPINVRNTNAPDDAGTMIVPARECEDSLLAGISAKRGLGRIRLRKLMLFKKSGIRHALLTMLHIFGIRPSFSLFGVDSIVWYYDSAQASESVLKAMCARLKSEFELDSIEVDQGLAVVGVVGEGVMTAPHLIAACSEALEKAGIGLNFFSYGGSQTSVLMGVRSEDADKAVETLYSVLF